MAAQATGSIRLNVVDGTRQAVSDDLEFLVRILDGSRRQVEAAETYSGESTLARSRLVGSLCWRSAILIGRSTLVHGRCCDKNVIVPCSDPLKSDQIASKQKSEKSLKSRVE